MRVPSSLSSALSRIPLVSTRFAAALWVPKWIWNESPPIPASLALPSVSAAQFAAADQELATCDRLPGNR